MFKHSPSAIGAEPGPQHSFRQSPGSIGAEGTSGSFVNSPGATGATGAAIQPSIMGAGAGGHSQGLESRTLSALPIAQHLQPNMAAGPRSGMTLPPALLRLIMALRSRGGL